MVFGVVALVGVMTGRVNSSAAILVGVDVSLFPRPARRSRWVTTPVTSWWSANVHNEGTANLAVPMKTKRAMRSLYRVCV